MKVFKAIRSAFGLGEFFAIIGTTLLCYGAWLVYEPAGFLVGGSLVLTAGILAAKSRGPKVE